MNADALLPHAESSSDASPNLLRPSKLGSYRLEHLIGRGGMGEVYRAHHETLDRDVAIKAIHESAIENEEHRRRFRQEARLAARLNHPAIVQIYDLLETDDGDFIVMELVQGSPLRMVQRDRSFDLVDILEIGRQVAEALAVAHRHGIMHRDLKAENVMLTDDGNVKLLDFGLARRFRLPNGGLNHEVLEDSGLVLGTLRAMSPEQARGEPLDGRSDLFSLGTLLYELSTGSTPFRGRGVAETLNQICTHYPPPVHRLRTDLPAELSRILDHLLEKDPVLRPQDADTVAASLKSLLRLFGDEHSSPAPAAAGLISESETGLFSSDWQDLTLRHVARGAEPQPTLPGRGDDLDELQRRWAGALAGQRQVVFVTGEAGVGKSALVGKFLRRIHNSDFDLACAEGRCLELHGAGEAYLPILEALGRLCRGKHGRSTQRALLQWAPSWLLQMPWLVEDDEREDALRRALGAGPARRLIELLEAVDAICRRRPLVLVIEDLHWSDVATLDLLSALARRIDPARLMLICTLRSSELAGAPEALQRVLEDLTLRGLAHEMPLRLLNEPETHQLLRAHYPQWQIPLEVAQRVHRHAGGNPLFSIHLAEVVVGEGEGSQNDQDDDEDPGLPRNLLRILESLLRRAEPDEQRILQAASIAGERFLLPVVVQAAKMEPAKCERILDDLAARRSFLRRLPGVRLRDGRRVKRYAFLHNIYRRVLRRRMGDQDITETHRIVAEAMARHSAEQGGSPANEPALHFELGRRPPKAIAQYQQASEVAVARNAFDAAMTYARRGRSLMPPARR